MKTVIKRIINENNYILYVHPESKETYIKYAFNKKIVYILFIHVSIFHRKQGLGTFLLKLCLEHALNNNMKYCELDSNYKNKNNMFLKAGMRFKSRVGPEMKGNIKDMLENI
jgi:hypothetical protein